MQSIVKHKKEIILGIIITALYFLLRLIYLERLPIFTDEAIYLRWAQIGLSDPFYRFVSLTDGKQPLFIWVIMIFMKFFKDPLIAGRMVSVLSGLFTMVGLFLVSQKLFKNTNISLMAALLYVVFPFAQVYDRMALFDTMVGTFYIWSLYLSLLLIEKPTLGSAFTLGFMFAGGLLTKSSNIFSLLLAPLTFFLAKFRGKGKTAKLFVYLGFSIVLSEVIYQGLLHLSPVGNAIKLKNELFIYSFGEWINHPFAYIYSNLNQLVPWTIQYLTPSYVILIIFAMILIFISFKEKFLLFLYFFIPFVALVFFGKLLYPRYVLFMTLPLLPLAAWSMVFIIKKINFKIKHYYLSGLLSAFLLLIFVVYPAFVSFIFAKDPINAPIPDRNQYAASWASGWGLRESVDFFKKQERENGKIFIGTEGTFGLLPHGLELYFNNDKNVQIKGYWWELNQEIPEDVAKLPKDRPVFFVFYQACPGNLCAIGEAPKGWNVTPVLAVKKEDGLVNYVVYKLIKK